MLELAFATLATAALLGAIGVAGRGIAVGLDRQFEGPGANYPGAVVAWWFLGMIGMMGALGIHVLFDAASPVLDPVYGGSAPWTAWVALTVAFVCATTALASLAASRGLRPVRRAAVTYGADPAHRRRKWVLLAVTWGLVPASLLLLLAGDSVGPLASAALLGYLTVYGVTHARWAFPLRPVDATLARDPDEAERSRLRDCVGTLDVEPGRFVVYEPAGDQTGVKCIGHGDRRRCWIAAPFLEDATDEELTVALAQAAAKTEDHFWERYRIGLLLLVGALSIPGVSLIGGIVVDPAAALVFVLAAVLGFVGLWSARRTTGRADQGVCESVGRETVLATYARHGETIQDSAAPADGLELLVPDPGVERRRERLE